LHTQGMDDVVVLVGGIIPDDDVEPLHKLGVKGVFGPGTSTGDIVAFIRQSVGTRDWGPANP
jgi:methylmalonyl-CoA mutase, C-terminal domain